MNKNRNARFGALYGGIFGLIISCIFGAISTAGNLISQAPTTPLMILSSLFCGPIFFMIMAAFLGWLIGQNADYIALLKARIRELEAEKAKSENRWNVDAEVSEEK